MMWGPTLNVKNIRYNSHLYIYMIFQAIFLAKHNE